MLFRSIEADADDAEDAHEDDGTEESRHGHGCLDVRLLDVHLARDEQVVVERHDRQHRAEEHHAVEPAFDRGREDVELGPEAGHERNAAERQQEHQHRERQFAPVVRCASSVVRCGHFFSYQNRLPARTT